MAQADSTEAPYGDIVALQPSHCFIPTISALDLATSDLFYDIAGEPDLLAMTPFDAVYFPAENEEHVAITAQNAEQFASHHVDREPLSVRERMVIVLERISAEDFTAFKEFFDPREGRMGVVVSFLAILELLKESLIELVQAEPYAPIYVKAKA